MDKINRLLLVLATVGVVVLGTLAGEAWLGKALAANSEHSYSLKRGATSFALTIKKPYKAILFPESREVTTSYSIVCLKNGVPSHYSRTFDTPFTRNLLYKIPTKQDVCYLAVAASSPEAIGQIVVDITTRS